MSAHPLLWGRREPLFWVWVPWCVGGPRAALVPLWLPGEGHPAHTSLPCPLCVLSTHGINFFILGSFNAVSLDSPRLLPWSPLSTLPSTSRKSECDHSFLLIHSLSQQESDFQVLIYSQTRAKLCVFCTWVGLSLCCASFRHKTKPCGMNAP